VRVEVLMRERSLFSDPFRGNLLMTRLLAIRGVLLCGLLGFAFAVGSAASAQGPTDKPKKDEPKKDRPDDQLFPQIPQIILPPDADPDLRKLEELRQMREQIQRQLGKMRGLQPGAFPN